MFVIQSTASLQTNNSSFRPRLADIDSSLHMH